MSTTRFAWAFAFLALTYPLSAEPVKVACIGDSITEGSGLSNPTVESYPAKLQKLLGTNYIVRNYGVSGRTLLKKGDFPYWKEAKFTASHDWDPDVVIIQLGTNDGKPYNWRYGTNFVSDYDDLVASYATLTSKPKVIACTPCPVYKNGAYDIQPGTIATNIAPAVRDIASSLGLQLIDLNVRLAGHPELFPDTVHPNTKGTTAMAAVICESLLGGYPTDPPPSISVGRPVPNRVVLTWPASWRGLIPQSATAFGLTNTTWSVAETVIYLDGDVMRQTNLVSGASRIYRLREP